MSQRKNKELSDPVSELESVMDAIKKYSRSTRSGYINSMNGKIYSCAFKNYKLFFEGNLPDNTKPQGLTDLEVLFTINFNYNENGTTIQEIFGKNHRQYRFELLFINDLNKERHISSWHLDYEPNETNRNIHPIFHLTFGGNQMKEIKENVEAKYGDLLLMPVPRWNYCPMDAVLGIDLIMSNFLKRDDYLALYSGKYKQAVENSKLRLWGDKLIHYFA